MSLSSLGSLVYNLHKKKKKELMKLIKKFEHFFAKDM